MKYRILGPLAAAGACLLLAACTSSDYPLSYQIPVGPPSFTSDFGIQNLPVNAVQDVPADPGETLYYTVVSPVSMNVYIFDKYGPYPGGPLLGQFAGASYSSSITPSGRKVEFVFSAIQPIGAGTIQLTVSETPPAQGAMGVQYSVPLTQQPLVALSPISTTVTVGQPVTITASGGAGSGAFVWGGPAAASGWSNQYTFNAPGTYTITVYRSGDNSYAQSNTATATVNATEPPAPPASSTTTTTTYSGNGNGTVTVTPIH